jgi:hypothetical protein
MAQSKSINPPLGEGWRVPPVEDDGRIIEENGRKTTVITTGGITISRLILPRKSGDRRDGGQYLGARFGAIARRASGRDEFGFGLGDEDEL